MDISKLKQCKNKHSVFYIIWNTCGFDISAILIFISMYLLNYFWIYEYIKDPLLDNFPKSVVALALIVIEMISIIVILGLGYIFFYQILTNCIVRIIHYITFVSQIKKLPLTKEECTLLNIESLSDYDHLLSELSRKETFDFENNFTYPLFISDSILDFIFNTYSEDEIYLYAKTLKEKTEIIWFMKDSKNPKYKTFYYNHLS